VLFGPVTSAIRIINHMVLSVINPKLHPKLCDQLLIIMVVTFIGLLENCGLLTEFAGLTQFGQCFLVVYSLLLKNFSTITSLNKLRVLFAAALKTSTFCSSSAIFANHTRCHARLLML